MHSGRIDDWLDVWLSGGAVTEGEFRLTPRAKVAAGLLNGFDEGHFSDGDMQP